MWEGFLRLIGLRIVGFERSGGRFLEWCFKRVLLSNFYFNLIFCFCYVL